MTHLSHQNSNQGRKSRLYLLTAFDNETPYLVPTEFESFRGIETIVSIVFLDIRIF